jgi:hypothetical protein
MKRNLIRITFVTLVMLAASPMVRAVDDQRLAALKTADDERVAATLAADRPRLTAVFSDDLRYAHSTGGVDTKASLIDAIAGGKTKYQKIEYEQREFTFPAPGIALMTGRARFKVEGTAGVNENTLAFLGVWREEQGKWRFLAWQSCRLPAPTPAK